ncbi:MAG TPA: TIGR02266 family protein [Candidatus Methylomirabilis sp.]|nr:TIGR02266 family protein [Candidatus Methylomirabilis sp.]
MDAVSQKDDRAPVQIQIEYGGEGPFFSAQSLNISRGGVFLQTEFLLPPGRAVQLNFQLPAGPRVSARGRVIWTRSPGDPRGPAGMGIQFETLPPEALRAIEGLLGNGAGRQSPA